MDMSRSLDNEQVVEELKSTYKFLKKYDNRVSEAFTYIKDSLVEKYGELAVTESKNEIVVYTDTKSILDGEYYVLRLIKTAIDTYLGDLKGFPELLFNNPTFLFKTLRIDNAIRVIRVKQK